ncbi:hypothetical protein CCMSSC00406_0005487 [Pleurotus cornucopiae]|uniref:Uncharacterized protein n=1 Tax=Pleurotus cornucopiae TaxID=5321 RepID=A0ACB7ITN1_PLECO|nr:hypothetical protein CCMSSC00406_0005487 [Pleurotus cornucopiae]
MFAESENEVSFSESVRLVTLFSTIVEEHRTQRPTTALFQTMASHLANIFGTEQDRVNCSFYYKIGACRHGDRCSRKHIRPPFSQTILLPNVYHNPAHDPVCKLTEKDLQEGFDAVYEDLYCELAKFGHLLELHVCDNVGDHLIGNVYARYEWETEAQAAVDNLNDRWAPTVCGAFTSDRLPRSMLSSKRKWRILGVFSQGWAALRKKASSSKGGSWGWGLGAK